MFEKIGKSSIRVGINGKISEKVKKYKVKGREWYIFFEFWNILSICGLYCNTTPNIKTIINEEEENQDRTTKNLNSSISFSRETTLTDIFVLCYSIYNQDTVTI